MATYKYEGIDKKGKTVRGTVDSASEALASRELLGKGVFVDTIHEVKAGKRSRTANKGKGRGEGKKFSWKDLREMEITFGAKSTKHVGEIFFQLSLLLRSGLPLVNSMKIVSSNTKSKYYADILMDMAEQVSEGIRFSEAVKSHGDAFPTMYTSLIQSSEKMGNIDVVLHDISIYEEQKRENLDKVTSAMVYPVVVLMVGIGVLWGMIAFVVPNMTSVFENFNAELPTYTKLMLGFSSFMQKYSLVMIALIVAGFFVFRHYYGNVDGSFRQKLNKRMYDIKFLRNVYISRYTYILSFQLKEGIPLTDAMVHANANQSNIYFRNELEVVRDLVVSGTKFSEALRSRNIFPELLVAASATGEQSGNMSGLLERVSTYYGKQVQKLLGIFVSMAEPLFLVFVGGIIGFMVISIMLPLLNINSVIE